MSLVKIKEYKARQYGIRGSSVSLPSVFTKDQNVKPGDILEIYRGSIGNHNDVLVIIPKNKETIPISENSLTETL